MKRLLLAVLLLLPSLAHAQYTKNVLYSYNNLHVSTNGVGGITGAILNKSFNNIILSMCGLAQASDCLLPNGVVGVPQVYDPRYYGAGAKCDGITDDLAAFTAAAAAAQTAGGGMVLVPATGAACVVSGTIVLNNGVGLKGVGATLNAGTEGSLALWTSAGSWLRNTSPSAYTVSLSGNGTIIRDLNFIRSQPIPSSSPGTPWTPNSYNFEVQVLGASTTVENVRMIAVTNGITFNFTTGSGGGTFTHMSHVDVDAARISVQFINVNDTLYVDDLKARSFYYAGNSNVVADREANAIGLDGHYFDNVVVTGFECFQTLNCITMNNGTAVGNTHSGYNIQFGKIACNVVVVCINVASTAIVSGHFDDILAQQDGGRTDTLFQFPTDSVDFSIGKLSVITTGGTVMSIGAGSRGDVKISQLQLGTNVDPPPVPTQYGYSTNQTGLPAFAVAAGARLSIGEKKVIRQTTAGAFIAGAGGDNVQMPTYCWTPFGGFGQITVSMTVSPGTFTTTNYTRSNYYGNFVQMRLYAQPNITSTAVGNLTMQMQNFTTDLAGNPISLVFSANSGGFASPADSNWRDINDTGAIVGRGLQSGPAGAAFQLGEFAACFR